MHLYFDYSIDLLLSFDITILYNVLYNDIKHMAISNLVSLLMNQKSKIYLNFHQLMTIQIYFRFFIQTSNISEFIFRFMY